jgi:hypothetical protein
VGIFRTILGFKWRERVPIINVDAINKISLLMCLGVQKTASGGDEGGVGGIWAGIEHHHDPSGGSAGQTGSYVQSGQPGLVHSG